MSKNSFLNYLNHALPNINTINRLNYLEAGCYGFSSYLAKKLSFSKIPYSYSSMQHGAFHLDFKDPHIITHHQQGMFNLVWSKLEGDLLKKSFIENYRITGAPYIYIDKKDFKNTKRKKKSLLVMPVHTSNNSNIIWNEEEYIKQILKYKNKFSEIVFCIHQNCLKNNLWIVNLKKYNIPYVIGAHENDTNSLLRMHIIFNSFDYMTTNSHGSHIYYALYSKCKVSIYGTIFSHTKSDLKNNGLDVLGKNIITEHELGYSKETMKSHYPKLFCKPHKATKRVNFAKKRLGHKYKKDYNQIAILLGWYTENYMYYQFSKTFNTVISNIKKLSDTKNKYVIYGNGTVASIIKPILNEQIICTVDKNSMNTDRKIKFNEAYPIETLNNVDYDYIIITPMNREKEIINNLHNKYNIPKEKLITLNPFQPIP